MPKLSARVSLLRTLDRYSKSLIRLSVLVYVFGESEDEDSSETRSDADTSDTTESEWTSESDDEILEVLYWKEQVKTNRYLTRNSIARAPNVFDFHMNQLDGPRFKQEFRMSKGAFVQIVSLIKDNHVFHNNSRNPQRPVNEQLIVTLKRFGGFGNGASVGMLARFFRISEGTV
ncbi:hypothetical protein PsorP6_017098 [Peronosclerospora sorghi]|uniref:Uncharacterized protein n=1 Tax=Peronosclerospora sorghi TaxID=230839 RepID=A0ACC0WBR7_9STRA|nr:hypothetical protein PsorP6_017098 [Peronosclerospora sorghi]